MEINGRAMAGTANFPRWLGFVWLFGLWGAHLVGLSLFINLSDFYDNPPIHYTDYTTHYAGVWTVQHLLDSGHLWGYDPYFHAGYPAGTLSDIDNKGIEMVTWLLGRCGLPLALAFNLLLLALMALSPLAVYLAGCLLGLSPPVSILALGLALVLWYGDEAIFWSWQGGKIAFLSASFLGLLTVAAFWRWAGLVEQGSPFSPALAGWMWFGLGLFLFWLHPLTFFILAVPLATGVLAAWRGGNWRTRLTPLAWALCVLGVNWPWLRLVLNALPYLLPSSQFLQGGWAQLWVDLRSWYMPFRLALCGLAFLGVWQWQQSGRRLWLPLAASLLTWFGLAYAGAGLGLGDTQPYRFIIAALLACTLPAAAALFTIWRYDRRAGLLLAGLLLLTAAPALYAGRPRHRLQADGTPRDHLSGPRLDEHAVCRKLQELDLQAGRVMTNDWRLGAYLPACSGAQTIGGPFLWVSTTYGFTNAGLDEMLGQKLAELSSKELGQIFVQYNIAWAVVNTQLYPVGYTLDEWDGDHPGLLQPLVEYGAYRIYAVQQPTSWFFKGSGKVSASYNRLEIRGASPGEVVLKYHWIDSLSVEPALPISPRYIGADPVPFIGVNNGNVADFVIFQDYHKPEP